MSPEPPLAPPPSRASDGPIRPGRRFGDTTLVRELGRGAQGVVYEGRQESVDRSVAVKILSRQAVLSGEQVDRFHREAEAAARLSHPNIVGVYGFEETEDVLLLVQELVAGGSLADLLAAQDRQGGTDVHWCRKAADLCRTLAEALHHAHVHGVVHRDMKPDNVLLTPEGVPKISDFGLARLDDKLGLSQTGNIMGTPHYMSPEQVSARPADIDARTDVYSLGALLYRMLAGRVPFEGKTLQGIFNDILTRAPKPLRSLQPDVTPDLEAVCLKALEKDPADRYLDARAFADDLSRYLHGDSTAARPLSLVGRTERLVRRQSSSALAMLSLLVPTAWLALDALLLAPLARADASRHLLRLALLVPSVLLFAWPLSLLASRVGGGRRGVVAGALLAALGLGAAAGWGIREGRLDQLHDAARRELAARLQLERAGDRPDVSDVEEYVAAWESRFGADDLLLAARAYLKRRHPAQAEPWLERLERQGGVAAAGPVGIALRLAVGDGLGRIDESEAVAGLLSSTASAAGAASWRDWVTAAEILQDTGRHAWAATCYRLAGALPEADRDLLNVRLAAASLELCSYDEALSSLQDVLKWRPGDPEIQRVHLNLLVADGRLAEAQHALQAALGNPALAPQVKLELLLGFQRATGDEAAWARTLDEALADARAPLDVLGLCGARALESARDAQEHARQAAAAGDGEGVARALEDARAWLERAWLAQRRLEALPGGGSWAHLHGAAVAMLAADADAGRQEELLEQARAHAEQAVARDGYSWEAHYNLGHATLRLARLRHGGFDALPDEDLLAYVDRMRRALACNGLQPVVLNNAAWVLGRLLAARTGDPALRDEALSWARRAAVITDPERFGGACGSTPEQRAAHSNAHDTLADLLEAGGDLAGALASARAARDALQADDASLPDRERDVLRLQELASGG